MTEVLSADEIDQLLRAINAGDDEPEDFKPANDVRKIKIYDFKRPDKFSKEQIRTVSILHETFARAYGTFLERQLRESCHVHVASVDQLTYEEFTRSIPTPTSLAVVKMSPLPSSMVVELDPEVSMRLFHSIYGGSTDSFEQHPLCHRSNSDLEWKLFKYMLSYSFNFLRESWISIIDARFSISFVEEAPYRLQVIPPSEMGVLVTHEIKIGETEGMLNLFYPALLLEPIMGKMTAKYWYKTHYKRESSNLVNFDNGNLEVEARVLVATDLKDYRFLKTLKVNDQIEFDKVYDGTVNLTINSHIWTAETMAGFKHNRIKIIEKSDNLKEEYMNEVHNAAPTVDLGDIKIQMSVELGRKKCLIKEILNFGEGTIIELDSLAGEPLTLYANNVAIAKGEVVVIDENFGLRLTEILDTSTYIGDRDALE